MKSASDSPDESDSQPVQPQLRSRFTLGLTGLVIGLIGLAAAISGPHVEEFFSPPEPPQKISDVIAETGDKIVGKMLDRLRGKPVVEAPPAPPPPSWGWYLSVTGSLLGIVGATFGTASWIRREDHRVSVSAITTGFLSVAWMYVVAGIVVALVIIVLIWFYGTVAG